MHRFSVVAVTAVAIAVFGATSPAQGQASGKGPANGAHAGGPAKGGGQPNRPSSPGGAADGSGAASKAGEHASRRASEKKTPRPSASKEESNASRGRTRSSGTAGSRAQSASEPNAIATKISNNPNQLARIKGMLPAGMTIEEASAGFRNQGQFIAALNASKSQQIDFVQLKEAMTVGGLSLGEAAREARGAAQ